MNWLPYGLDWKDRDEYMNIEMWTSNTLKCVLESLFGYGYLTHIHFMFGIHPYFTHNVFTTANINQAQHALYVKSNASSFMADPQWNL